MICSSDLCLLKISGSSSPGSPGRLSTRRPDSSSIQDQCAGRAEWGYSISHPSRVWITTRAIIHLKVARIPLIWLNLVSFKSHDISSLIPHSFIRLSSLLQLCSKSLLIFYLKVMLVYIEASCFLNLFAYFTEILTITPFSPVERVSMSVNRVIFAHVRRQLFHSLQEMSRGVTTPIPTLRIRMNNPCKECHFDLGSNFMSMLARCSWPLAGFRHLAALSTFMGVPRFPRSNDSFASFCHIIIISPISSRFSLPLHLELILS